VFYLLFAKVVKRVPGVIDRDGHETWKGYDYLPHRTASEHIGSHRTTSDCIELHRTMSANERS